MIDRLAAILQALRAMGRVPKSIRKVAAIWGLVVLSIVVIPFIWIAWGSDEATGDLIAYAGLVSVIGLAALLGGKNGN